MTPIEAEGVDTESEAVVAVAVVGAAVDTGLGLAESGAGDTGAIAAVVGHSARSSHIREMYYSDAAVAGKAGPGQGTDMTAMRNQLAVTGNKLVETRNHAIVGYSEQVGCIVDCCIAVSAADVAQSCDTACRTNSF